MTAVVGGVYAEECLEPFWNDVSGSGGRAAAALETRTATLSRRWTLAALSWSLKAPDRPDWSHIDARTRCHEHLPIYLRIGASATGC